MNEEEDSQKKERIKVIEKQIYLKIKCSLRTPTFAFSHLLFLFSYQNPPKHPIHSLPLSSFLVISPSRSSSSPKVCVCVSLNIYTYICMKYSKMDDDLLYISTSCVQFIGVSRLVSHIFLSFGDNNTSLYIHIYPEETPFIGLVIRRSKLEDQDFNIRIHIYINGTSFIASWLPFSPYR